MDVAEIEALRRENDELRLQLARSNERARRAARLRGLTARLASSLDRVAIFDEIVRAAHDLCGSQGAALLLLDEEKGVLHVESSVGLDGDSNLSLPVGQTVAKRALDARSALAIEDMAGVQDLLVPRMYGRTPGAFIVAPIRVEGRPFGVVEAYYQEPRSIPQDDIDVLDALSNAAAIALRNATAYARILEQGAELARRNEELARQKEELGRLNDELRRANVLKSQFLATMSHELRTPLTSIIGFSSILLRGRRGETLSERQRDNAERILASARHLVTLINDILDLSRIEAGRLDIFRREVDLGELLEGLRVEMEPQAYAKGLFLHMEAGSDLDRVVTDADRLRQVLVNLIGNAIKFTHQGGVTVRASRNGDSITISVEDSGIGIAPDQQERIFDEFYQADQSSTRAAGGTGLGLAISRRLVSLLDGHLTMRSMPGEGSTFTVILPSRPGATLALRPAPSGASYGPLSDEARVLVIDDDPEMVVLLERALEGTPYVVTGALSADEGLKKAEEIQPYAIMLDVMMPETDGWRALHHLKRNPRTAHIPVIMHTIVADQALGFSLGATDYLVKPVERAHLLATLNRLTPVESGPVLIVDDDENMRLLLASILSEERVAVQTAASGEEALQMLIHQKPRLILLDLMMPGIDGFEVLHRLRTNAETRHIPVIVVTAKMLTPEEEHLLHQEASSVITKNGVPVDRLLDNIRGAIEAVE